MGNRLLLICLAALMGGPVMGQNSEKDPNTELMARITAAWQKRQDLVKSARFFIEDENTKHKDNPLLTETFGKTPSEPTPKPERDVVMRVRRTLTLDGTSMRYAYETSQWASKLQAYRPLSHVSIYHNNIQSRLFSFPEQPQESHANISPARQPGDAEVITIVPLSLNFRGTMERYLNRKLQLYEVSRPQVQMEGRACVELVRLNRAEGSRSLMYLDIERDYVPRLLETYHSDKLTGRSLIDYQQDPDVGWVPKSWSCMMRTSKGVLIHSAKVVVERYEINPVVDSSEFQMKYPSGTVVFDETKGTNPVQVSKTREDGSVGESVPLTDLKVLDQLDQINTASAESTQQYRTILGVAALLILMACVGIILYRRGKS